MSDFYEQWQRQQIIELTGKIRDPNPNVRIHAIWTLRGYAKDGRNITNAIHTLLEAYVNETDAEVRGRIPYALRYAARAGAIIIKLEFMDSLERYVKRKEKEGMGGAARIDAAALYTEIMDIVLRRERKAMQGILSDGKPKAPAGKKKRLLRTRRVSSG